MTAPSNPTACLLIIGNEVLSGRTRDANLQYIARRLGEIGIPLREARVIPDDRAVIVATVNEVRAKFDHVFTTGGIGPTHDDITSECIAEAFGVPWEPHPEAWARLDNYYRSRGSPGDFNPARQRMATMPRGATLIDNVISLAPGFTMGNVHVLAGVPRICQAMFEALAPRLRGGPPIVSRTVHAHGMMEGRIAEGLADIQRRWPEVDIGSYPYYRPAGGGGVAVVAKGTDPDMVRAAAQDVAAFMRAAGGHPVEGEPA
ncbi:molybdenum cofactor biosynthesis protein [Caldovatus sediminis]|jgi:molybdenum cofactor synthesis domain-containing protein|uniref:Molybdenum cofactor biosynthesis protein n=1 Tax=Caldovatus sediminis TaxID=2041189 RepID=A0A8J2ZB52_9PROT|nr:molybdopterin-binding protein [Caldovatus sediminis]GGG32930.1 molybdenum cofactor biosynthesis protein [Caldovatus sediminis]